jgi:hypothetical protein
MAGVRFEDVDLLGALSRIVDLHTQHYKEDFDLDKELISKLAVSERSEDKQLLWMSRPCGTYTLRERPAMKTKCGGFTRSRQMIPFWLMPSL